MVIERTNRDIIVRIPSFVGFEEVQRIVDLIIYKELTAQSQATQTEVDAIAKEAKKGWWQANRKEFMRC